MTATASHAPPIPRDVSRVAVVCPSWVGDTVMATPVLRAVRRHRPKAHVTAACRPGLDELLAGAPWIDEIACAPSGTLPGMLRLARRLRRGGVEAVLLLPNSFRSALLARLAGASVRLGYRRSGRGALLSAALDPPPRGAPVAAVEYYARLAAWALGEPAIEARPELVVTEAQRRAAAALLEGVPRPFALLCPGANRPDKRWPAERFAAVAAALHQRHGLAAVVTGAPGERAVAAAVVAAAAAGAVPVVNLVERGITIGALKGVAAEAAVMITNDTGPRHVAAALGTPVVALFGPTDHRWTTLPDAREHLLVAEPFLPPDLAADDHPRACAITRIAVGDVLAATGRLLAATGGQGPAVRGEAPGATPPDRAAGP